MTKVNFNAAIDEIYVAVMKRFPLARFYEAQGYLTEDVNGDVKCDSVKLAFGLPDNATVIGTLD